MSRRLPYHIASTTPYHTTVRYCSIYTYSQWYTVYRIQVQVLCSVIAVPLPWYLDPFLSRGRFSCFTGETLAFRLSLAARFFLLLLPLPLLFFFSSSLLLLHLRCSLDPSHSLPLTLRSHSLVSHNFWPAYLAYLPPYLPTHLFTYPPTNIVLNSTPPPEPPYTRYLHHLPPDQLWSCHNLSSTSGPAS